MFEIGSSLRQARQHRKLELADVERATHIRVKYLGALEDDRFEVLPGPAYARGFLRTYAEFLGLDGDLLVDEFNTHVAPPEEEQPSLQPPSLRRAGSSLARPAAGIVVALVAAMLVVWQLGFSSPHEETLASAGALPQAPKAKAKPAPATRPVPGPARRAAAKPVLVVVATGGPWGKRVTGLPHAPANLTAA